jgi:RNA polymerase-binding transcription factor DksA
VKDVNVTRARAAASRSGSNPPETGGVVSTAGYLDMLGRKVRQVQGELEGVDRRLSAKGDYGPGIGDPRIYEWEMNLARRARLQARLRSIEEAIERAESGDYGICEQCSGRIRVERLQVIPFTRLCIECARQKSKKHQTEAFNLSPSISGRS